MKWPLPHRRLTYWSSVSVCLSVPGVAYWYWCGLSVHLSLSVAGCLLSWSLCAVYHTELSLCFSLDHIVAMVCLSVPVMAYWYWCGPSVCLSVTGCRLRQSSCAVYHANHVCVSRLLVSASFSLRRHRRVKQVSASTCHWAGSQRSSTTNSCM